MPTELDRGTIVDIDAPEGHLFNPDLAVDMSTPTQRARYLAGAFLTIYRNPRTFEAYRTCLHDWFDFLAGVGVVDPIVDVTRAPGDLYALELKNRGLSARTIYRRLSILTTFYRYLHEEGYRADNPLARVNRPALPRESVATYMTAREANAFLHVAKDRGGYPYALCTILVLNGLRVSEACNANIEHLGQDDHVPWLTIVGKGDQPAKVALAPETKHALDKAINGRSWGPLLLNRDSRRMQRDAANRIVKRTARDAGIKKRISCHSCRHTAITLHNKAKKDPYSTQRFARHADIRTTMGYIHADEPLTAHGTFAVAAFLAGAD